MNWKVDLMTSFVNHIHGMWEEVENKNKALMKSVEFYIRERVSIMDLQLYDWKEQLELKTEARRECLVYHMAQYIVNKSSELLSAVIVMLHLGTVMLLICLLLYEWNWSIWKTASNDVYHIVLQAETIKLSSPYSTEFR